MSSPGGELKAAVPCPPYVGGSPENYSTQLAQKVGIHKVEIINNEVIAAGQLLASPDVISLVHCRVTANQLEFTVRSNRPDASQQLLSDLTSGFK